ncbi:hypothetical protein ACVW0I_003318 [Bradyrhizobium sp. LM6.11]
MTLIDQMKAEPWRFDFFHTLRQFERANPDRPRIGDSAARRDEYIELGQSALSGVPRLEPRGSGRPEWPAQDTRQISRPPGPAGRPAHCHHR